MLLHNQFLYEITYSCEFHCHELNITFFKFLYKVYQNIVKENICERKESMAADGQTHFAR